MKRLAKRILVLIVIAALILGGLFAMRHKKQKLASAPKAQRGALPVRVVPARAGSLDERLNYLATVEPRLRSRISARLTATVQTLHCDEGDWVRAGDLLLTLDLQEIRDEMASLDAEIARTEAQRAANEATVASLQESAVYRQREAERDRTLADKGDIPSSQAEASVDKARQIQGQLDAATQQSTALAHLVTALQAKRAQLETRLAYGSITSPYDGIVTQRLVDAGDLATPGKTLLVVDDRRLKLSFDVPQQDLDRVHEGLTVTYGAAGKVQRMSLSHLFPSLDASRMQRAEVFLEPGPAQGLTRGQTLSVSVLLDNHGGGIETAVIVPATSIVECPKHFQHVFVVEDGQLTHHKVTVLASAHDQVAVTGIDPNTPVVTNTFLGWTTLSAGKKVEVLK